MGRLSHRPAWFFALLLLALLPALPGPGLLAACPPANPAACPAAAIHPGPWLVYLATRAKETAPPDNRILVGQVALDGGGLSKQGELTSIAPPGERISDIQAISDQAGGLYLAMVRTGPPGSTTPAGAPGSTTPAGAHGSQLLVQRMDAQGKSLWEGDQRVVADYPSPDEAIRVALVAAGAEGVIVVFSAPAGSEPSGILAQKFSPQGVPLWNQGRPLVVAPAAGRLLRNPVARSDSAGGAVVAFESSDSPAGDVQIEAQRLSSAGKLLWNQGRPRMICPYLHRAGAVALVPDGAGGTFFIFEIELLGGVNQGECDILAMRINADGSSAWNEPKIISSTPNSERRPVAVSDGRGGAIIAFEGRLRPGTGPDDYDILGQRIDGDGQRLWNQGNPIFFIASTDDDREPVLVPDGRGGVLAFCATVSRGTAAEVEKVILGARITADGSLPWKEGKETIVLADAENYWAAAPAAVTDGQGGALAAFRLTARGETTAPGAIGLVRIDREGKLLWNQGREPVKVSAPGMHEALNPILVDSIRTAGP